MLALSIALALLSSSPLPPAEEKAASVEGKYQKLLRVMTMPQDAERYGDFNDWGWWSGTEYQGHEGLSPGYWVWVKPRWYVWASQRPVTDPSFGHKYSGLLRTVEAPGDVSRYGQAYDYGWWSGTSYLGATDLPKAYWTYVAPRWYLWSTERPGTAPAQ